MALDEGIPLDRIPPQSLEMEQATLGCMLVDRAAIEKAADVLKPEDFYRREHRILFEAMVTLATRDEPVDLYSVQEQLKSQEKLDIVGGAPFLVQLTNAFSTTANVDYYARMVEEKSILRKLIDAAGQINAAAHSDYGDIGEVVDKAERSVFGVAQRRIGAYFTPMRPLVNSVFEQIEYRSENKDSTTGVPTGLIDFNRITAGLQPSDLIIIAARPSMGKTSLALGMAQHAAAKGGHTAAIFSFEMSKEQLCLRMICSEARVDAHRLRTGYLQDQDWKKVGDACATLSEAPIFIDDSPECSVLEMRAKCRRLKAEHNLGIVVVDYMQQMRGSRRTENRVQEIGEISRSLKSLARELSVPVVALSQLSRAVEQRPDKRPMLSDLRESGSIEADADVVVFIYREEYYKMKEAMSADTGAESAGSGGDQEERLEKAQLIVAKHRNGPTGMVEVGFHTRYARFDNLAKEYA